MSSSTINTVIIDVRDALEFVAGHVHGAMNIPLPYLADEFPDKLKNIDKNAKIIVYCRTGNRSSYAVEVLMKYGFHNVVNGINQDTTEQLINSSDNKRS